MLLKSVLTTKIEIYVQSIYFVEISFFFTLSGRTFIQSQYTIIISIFSPKSDKTKIRLPFSFYAVVTPNKGTEFLEKVSKNNEFAPSSLNCHFCKLSQIRKFLIHFAHAIF